MTSLSFDNIPGLNEALEAARQKQYTTRENSLLNITYDILGFKIRTMSIGDYVVLERHKSPFLNRLVPSMDDLAFFLWFMSPKFKKYEDRNLIRPLVAFLHSRKVGKKFGGNIPETSEPAVVRCFEYIDTMFFDSPPTAVQKGRESCICFLTNWFDIIQSEYHFSHEVMWNMGLPELFQRLAAIRLRNNPELAAANKNTDDIKAFIVRGLRNGQFTEDDLRSGKVKEFGLN